MKLTPARRRGAVGFSLVELLVVIAVIAILSAILIPTINNVRHSSRRTQAVSNMRQTYAVLLLFTQDNNGYLPVYNVAATGRNWWQHLRDTGYIAQPQTNVNDIEELGSPALRAMHPDIDKKATFQINGMIARQDPDNPALTPDPNRIEQLTLFPDLTKTYLLFEGKVNNVGTGYQMVAWPTLYFPPEKVYNDESCLITYTDGRVEMIRVDDIPTTAPARDREKSLFWRGYWIP